MASVFISNSNENRAAWEKYLKKEDMLKMAKEMQTEIDITEQQLQALELEGKELDSKLERAIPEVQHFMDMERQLQNNLCAQDAEYMGRCRHRDNDKKIVMDLTEQQALKRQKLDAMKSKFEQQMSVLNETLKDTERRYEEYQQMYAGLGWASEYNKRQVDIEAKGKELQALEGTLGDKRCDIGKLEREINDDIPTNQFIIKLAEMWVKNSNQQKKLAILESIERRYAVEREQMGKVFEAMYSKANSNAACEGSAMTTNVSNSVQVLVQKGEKDKSGIDVPPVNQMEAYGSQVSATIVQKTDERSLFEQRQRSELQEIEKQMTANKAEKEIAKIASVSRGAQLLMDKFFGSMSNPDPECAIIGESESLENLNMSQLNLMDAGSEMSQAAAAILNKHREHDMDQLLCSEEIVTASALYFTEQNHQGFDKQQAASKSNYCSAVEESEKNMAESASDVLTKGTRRNVNAQPKASKQPTQLSPVFEDVPENSEMDDIEHMTVPADDYKYVDAHSIDGDMFAKPMDVNNGSEAIGTFHNSDVLNKDFGSDHYKYVDQNTTDGDFTKPMDVFIGSQALDATPQGSVIQNKNFTFDQNGSADDDGYDLFEFGKDANGEVETSLPNFFGSGMGSSNDEAGFGNFGNCSGSTIAPETTGFKFF